MVSKLFDTSALFASCFMEHPFFAWSDERVDGVDRGEVRGFISTHTLVELYASLTVYPKTRLSPTAAVAILERFTEIFQVVSLELSDYQAVLARAQRLELVSGVVYDILHAQAFLKVKADSLVTLNAKHFLRLGEDIESRVESPL